MSIFLHSQRRSLSSTMNRILDAIFSQMRSCSEAIKNLRGCDKEAQFRSGAMERTAPSRGGQPRDLVR